MGGMMRGMAAAAALVATSTLLLPAGWAADWEEINDKDGVKVFRKEVAGSDVVAFKGDTIADGSVARILWILVDNEHRIEWVDRLYENKELERVSAHEYIVYQAFKLPIFISNRDYVYRGKAKRVNGTDQVELHLASTVHPKAPETIGVRANLINSRYLLTPVDGGKRTRIEVEIHTDPRGLLPTWLVNLIQKSWPLKTLKGIKAQLKKPHVKDYPLPPAGA